MKTESPASIWRLSSSGSRRDRNQLAQELAAADQAGDEEAEDAQNQQGAREPSHPVQQARVFLEGVAEQAAGKQKSADPESRSQAVKQQEAVEGHAVLAGDRRRQRSQPRNKLRDQERSFAAVAEGVLRFPHAKSRLERELTEDPQDMVTETAADEIPDAVGHDAASDSCQQRQRKAELMLGGQSPGGQKDRRSGQRYPPIARSLPKQRAGGSRRSAESV